MDAGAEIPYAGRIRSRDLGLQRIGEYGQVRPSVYPYVQFAGAVEAERQPLSADGSLDVRALWLYGVLLYWRRSFDGYGQGTFARETGDVKAFHPVRSYLFHPDRLAACGH